MKSILIILLFSITLSSVQAYDYPVWPSVLTKDSLFYRGQNTGYISFKQLIKMLKGEKDIFIKSRFFRTIQKIKPKLTNTEISLLIDQQVEHWKKQGMIWQILECHADTYGCSMPTVKSLMGVVIKANELPYEIDTVFQRQESGGRNYLSLAETNKVLSFFDPVVSTSYDIKIAKRFMRDSEKNLGYVLYLKDINHRNCSERLKSKADCFINHEEYLEELEVPFMGYVNTSELFGFESHGVIVSKKDNAVYVKDINTKEQLKLQTEFTSKDQCQLYNKKLQQIVKFKKLADQMVSTCH